MTKRMRYAALAAGAIALAALIVGIPALAGDHGPKGHRGHGGPHGFMEGRGHGPDAPFHHLKMIAHDLELTETQREQLHEIVKGAMDGELGETMKALREAHRALGKLVHDPQASEQQIRDAARAMSELAERSAVERHGIAVALDGLLTEEQRARFAEIRAEHEARGDMPGPPRRPHPPRPPHLDSD